MGVAMQPFEQRSLPTVRPVMRVLVIATEDLSGPLLAEELRHHLTPWVAADVRVVAPAIARAPMRRLLDPADRSADEAASSLARMLAALDEAGIPARGEIGDSDPLVAAEEALHDFDADEILLTERAR